MRERKKKKQSVDIFPGGGRREIGHNFGKLNGRFGKSDESYYVQSKTGISL